MRIKDVQGVLAQAGPQLRWGCEMTALAQLYRCKDTCSAAVLVIHSWWGLTASFHDYATALSAGAVDAGLVDLFDGATTDDPKEAAALRKRPRRQPVYRQLLAALEELRAASLAERIGVAGFSMGGHWAVWLAQWPEARVDAAVLYYAARAGNFSASQAAFLAHFAESDPWVSPAARRRMERALAATSRPYAAHDYSGTGHWFAESAHPAYAPAAAQAALDRDAEFFGKSQI